jgi:hypothetical protein
VGQTSVEREVAHVERVHLGVRQIGHLLLIEMDQTEISHGATGIPKKASGKKRAEPRVAQVEPDPEKTADIHWKEDVAEERIADAHVKHDGAAEKSGEENGADNGRARNEIDNEAEKLEHADCDGEIVWNSEPLERVGDRLDVRELDREVEEQEQHRERGDDTPGPTLPR